MYAVSSFHHPHLHPPFPPFLTYKKITDVVDRLEERHPGIFGPSGGYSRAYSLCSMSWTLGMLLGPLLSGCMTFVPFLPSFAFFFSPLISNDNNNKNKLTNPLFSFEKKKLGLHQIIGYSNMESVLGESTLSPPFYSFPVPGGKKKKPNKQIRGRIKANQWTAGGCIAALCLCSAVIVLFFLKRK